jgi:3,5-dihydroxyphenylacetyl-CoA synthase
MQSYPAILTIGTANPAQRYSQEQIYNLMQRSSPFYRTERVRQIFMTSDIDHRHFCFDIDSFTTEESIDEMHERFRKGSMELGRAAIERCLRSAAIDVSDIDYIIAVSCTGYLCPGLSALLSKELNLRRDIQRADLLGMGCSGAMPGLQRAYDFVRAYPDKKALLLTVEICSACYYIDDSLDTVVGNAICADGAAALVVGMSDDPRHPKIIGFESLLEPSYIHTVGFEHREGRLRIILSKDLRDGAGLLAGKLVMNLLQHYSVPKQTINHWILHSGGRKVIDSIQKELSLTDNDVRHTRHVLRQYGNMSSPTVLFVLQETLNQGNPREAEFGLMLALGPGLAVEGALLKW